MTAPRALSNENRLELLTDLANLHTDDDDATQQDPKWFLPLESHARALRPETLVVRAGRGAGKTALFNFLGHVARDASLGRAVSAPPNRWIEGFSRTIDHPSVEVLGSFATGATDDDRRFFWFGWLCVRIALALRIDAPAGLVLPGDGTARPADIAEKVRSSLSELTAWLDSLERVGGGPLVITYDYLDRIKCPPLDRQRLIASLLAMWLALADRYRRVRPKIFVREDLFQAALAAYPDASKLDARSVSLDWRVEDLYRVLIKHMGNLSDGLREWITSSNRKIPLTQNGLLGWTPPPTLPETGPMSQKCFVDHLAGERMGVGEKKGFTYRWIPNRLQDAHSRVVPRSMLSLVRNAAEDALKRGPSAQNLRLLHPHELANAIEKTSKRRVKELQEEFPVVARLESLRGRSVMLDRRLVVKALSETKSTPDDHGDDGDAVLRELLELGVMSERIDGRIDIPDIYRYDFGILRKGGVRRSA